MASDTASVTFAAPGVHTLAVEVADDDGGSAAASLVKLITNNIDCTRSQGFWRHQFKPGGRHPLDDATLEAYLAIVNFTSAVFSEQLPASTLEEARSVLQRMADDDEDGEDDDDDDPANMRGKAQAQLLAAWLNFAQGSVGWDELITIGDDDDDDDEGVAITLPFYEAMAQAEAILLNPDATHEDLERAKELAEAVNAHDEDNPACDENDGDDDGDDVGQPGNDDDDGDQGKGKGRGRDDDDTLAGTGDEDDDD